MNDREFDALLRKALMDANLQDFQEILSQENEIRWSSRYHVQRKKLLADPWKWYRNRKRPIWKKALHNAACLLLACCLGFFTLMGVSPTLRAAMLRWGQEVYDSQIVYRFWGEPVKEEMPEYQICALPEGYAEVRRTELKGYVRVTYQNEDGQNIYLTWTWMKSGRVLSIGTANMEISEVMVNNNSGQFYQALNAEEASAVIWVDEEANIMFLLGAFSDKLEILHMAESVYLYKTQK